VRRRECKNLGSSDEGMTNFEEAVLAEHDLQLPPRSSHGCETLEGEATRLLWFRGKEMKKRKKERRKKKRTVYYSSR